MLVFISINYFAAYAVSCLFFIHPVDLSQFNVHQEMSAPTNGGPRSPCPQLCEPGHSSTINISEHISAIQAPTPNPGRVKVMIHKVTSVVHTNIT